MWLSIISLPEVFCALHECFLPAGDKTSDGNGVGMDVDLCLRWVMRMEPRWRRMLALGCSAGL